MKKIYLLICLFILLSTSACIEIDWPDVGDYTIDFTDSNSIVVKRNVTATQIFKAYDADGRPCLLETKQVEILNKNTAVVCTIELPETITDFKIVGHSDNNIHKFSYILLDTNDGLYVIIQDLQPVDYHYNVKKIDNKTYSKIKNILYKGSHDKRLDYYPFYINNILKYSSIINRDSCAFLSAHDNELLLNNNISFENAFFLLAYDDYFHEYGYNNFVLIDSDKKAYYYIVSPDLSIIVSKEYSYDSDIINYGPIMCDGFYNSAENNPYADENNQNNNHFYILTENELFIYDRFGELQWSEVINDKVYGINFVNQVNLFELQLAYKTEDNLFKWETKVLWEVNSV